MTGQQWLLLAVVVSLAVVIIFALWKGGAFGVEYDAGKFSFNAKERASNAPPIPASSGVVIGKDATVDDAELGKVTGVRGASTATDVNIFGGAKITGGSKIGDITGVDASGTDRDA